MLPSSVDVDETSSVIRNEYPPIYRLGHVVPLCPTLCSLVPPDSAPDEVRRQGGRALIGTKGLPASSPIGTCHRPWRWRRHRANLHHGTKGKGRDDEGKGGKSEDE
jgi:hypothetical protein